MAGKYGSSGPSSSETQLGERFHVSRPTAARACVNCRSKVSSNGSWVPAATSATEALPFPPAAIAIQSSDSRFGNVWNSFEVVCGELARIAHSFHDCNLLLGKQQPFRLGQRYDGRRGRRIVQAIHRAACERRLFSPCGMRSRRKRRACVWPSGCGRPGSRSCCWTAT